jgi:hypothetical protein
MPSLLAAVHPVFAAVAVHAAAALLQVEWCVSVTWP